MEKNTVILAILTFILGFGGGFLLGGREAETGTHIMPNGALMQDHDMSMGSAMDDMMAGLEGKRGDEFDRAFLDGMIVHHEGAVDMAEAALMYAGHQEIKDMAKAIISAQAAEIGQMRDWRDAWY
jgi:uncharacterized protein (DUF305 family)